MNDTVNKNNKRNISVKRERTFTSEQIVDGQNNMANAAPELKIGGIVSEREPIKNILFVDDEEPIRHLFKKALEKFGYNVTLAADGNQGIACFREKPVDLILTDIFMPEKDGHAFIHEIMQDFPLTKIFALTGKKTLLGMETELDIAKTLGASKVFTKPVKLSVLIHAIQDF